MSRAKRHALALVICFAAALLSPAVAFAACTTVGPAKIGATCNQSKSTSPSSSQSPSAAGGASRLLSLTNGERSKAGVGLLSRSATIEEISLKHAKEMADAGKIYHNPALFQASTRDAMGDPDEIGENVGRGSDVDSIHAAFMNSASHRANILDGGFVLAGFAVVSAKGELWVVETFTSQPHAASSNLFYTADHARPTFMSVAPFVPLQPDIGAPYRWQRPGGSKQAPGAEEAQVLGIKQSFKSPVRRGAAGIAIVMVFSAIVGAALPRRRADGEYV